MKTGSQGEHSSHLRLCLGGLLLLSLGAHLSPAAEGTRSSEDMARFMAEASSSGRVRMARKTKAVDARPARRGEIVVTVIAGEGVETRSRAAEAGDWVVRNRCPSTGNEEYLVAGDKFAGSYRPTRAVTDREGFREFRPKAAPKRFALVRTEDGEFTFVAPWGEPMVARPGDAIVQDPKDERDIYRVAARSFECTYEVEP